MTAIIKQVNFVSCQHFFEMATKASLLSKLCSLSLKSQEFWRKKRLVVFCGKKKFIDDSFRFGFNS